MIPLLPLAGKALHAVSALLFGKLGLHGLSMALGAGVTALVLIYMPALSIGPVTLWEGGFVPRLEAYRAKLGALETRLSTCQGNVSTLEASLEAQNTAIQSVSDQGQARITESTERLSERDIDRAVAQARAEWMRTRPIAGDTQCERVLDVIGAFRETLE